MEIMRSKVAEEVRRAQIEADLRLTPAERIARALSIGERQLAHFAAANRLGRAEALLRLRENKQKGRS